jgi:hypothetical protein
MPRVAQLIVIPDRMYHRTRPVRDDGEAICIRCSKRVLVLRQESEPEGWLRRQLAFLSSVSANSVVN